MDEDESPKPSTSKVIDYTDDEDEEDIITVCQETRSIELAAKSTEEGEIKPTESEKRRRDSLRANTRGSVKRRRDNEEREKARSAQPRLIGPDGRPKKRKLFFMEEELPDQLDLNFYDSAVDRLTQFFGTYDPIDPKYSLPLELRVELDNPHLFNLRRLKIANMIEIEHFRFDCVNNFKQLEHLEIEIREPMWQYSGEVNIIKLPKLTTLSAHLCCVVLREIIFDCPINNLEVEYKTVLDPKFEPLARIIKLKDPSVVKRLNVMGLFKLSSLEQFTGVEQFHYPIEDLFELKHSQIIETLPSLQILGASSYSDSTSAFRVIKEFRESRERSKRDIEIYVNSINLDRLLTLHLSDADFRPENELRLQITNYDYLFEFIECGCRIFYSELVEVIGNSTPADFHDRYRSIEEVIISRPIQNTDHFVEFLNNCMNLKKVCFLDTNINQEVFDQIGKSNARHRISNLEINVPTGDYDFDFLIELTNLAWFTTNQKVKRRVFTRFAKLKYLEYFTSLFKKLRIEIFISDDKKYTLLKGINFDFLSKYLEDGTLTTLVNRLK